MFFPFFKLTFTTIFFFLKKANFSTYIRFFRQFLHIYIFPHFSYKYIYLVSINLINSENAPALDDFQVGFWDLLWYERGHLAKLFLLKFHQFVLMRLSHLRSSIQGVQYEYRGFQTATFLLWLYSKEVIANTSSITAH